MAAAPRTREASATRGRCRLGSCECETQHTNRSTRPGGFSRTRSEHRGSSPASVRRNRIGLLTRPLIRTRKALKTIALPAGGAVGVIDPHKQIDPDEISGFTAKARTASTRKQDIPLTHASVSETRERPNSLMPSSIDALTGSATNTALQCALRTWSECRHPSTRSQFLDGKTRWQESAKGTGMSV